MKSKFLMKIFAAVLFVCVCSGCSLISPSVSDINYYDLTFAGSERLTVPYLVVYRNFQNISPVKMNLIYSESNSLQVLDQYNLWTQSPENMLQRYLLNAVKSDTKAARQVIVTLSVYEFRFDIVGKKCQLGITGRIMESHEGKKFEKNYMVEIPVETVERTAFINGMNKCVLEFTKQLVNDIQKF